MSAAARGWTRPVLAGLLVFCLALFAGCKKTPPPPPPPVVEVITPTPTNVPIYEEWIATLDGFVNAQIRAQVSGYLISQNYREGSTVQPGDVLFQIDPRPFQAALEQAKAKQAQDEAQSIKTALDVKRYTPLARDQAISRQELDDAIQADAGAKAQIKADEALIDTAQLNLGFTKITSPVRGVAGLAVAQLGNLVGPATGVLTTVSDIDPMKAYFQVSEQSYLNFWRRFVVADKMGQVSEALKLELILSDNSVYPERGSVYFIDRQVDQNTGTIQVVGLFSNANYLLRPGQYGRIRAQTHFESNVFLIPQRAVAELQGSYQVIVVDAQNKAHPRTVQIGEQVGANWIIKGGLKEGEQVIVEGTQKAQGDGKVVAPQPYTNAPSASPPATNTPAQ